MNFDKIPPVAVVAYDQHIQKVMPGYQNMFKMSLALFRSVLTEPAPKLLIVGAGTGMELVSFGVAQPGWIFQAVDPSKQMLEIARQKAEQEGLAARVNFHQGLVSELPAGRQYDAATCILVMHFLRDDGAKLALLQSIAERLKPGAYFILVDNFGDKHSESFRQLVAARKEYLELGGFTSEQSEADNAVIWGDMLHLITEARTLELLEAAGFSQVVRFHTGLIVGGWVATRND